MNIWMKRNEENFLHIAVAVYEIQQQNSQNYSFLGITKSTITKFK